MERHVRDLGIGYTFLRPNLFFQGLLAFAKTISAEDVTQFARDCAPAFSG